jgi:hypothetical protein
VERSGTAGPGKGNEDKTRAKSLFSEPRNLNYRIKIFTEFPAEIIQKIFVLTQPMSNGAYLP